MNFKDLNEKYCAVCSTVGKNTIDSVTIFKKNKENKYWEKLKYFVTDIENGLLLSLRSKCFFNTYNIEEEEYIDFLQKYYDKSIPDKTYYAFT